MVLPYRHNIFGPSGLQCGNNLLCIEIRRRKLLDKSAVGIILPIFSDVVPINRVLMIIHQPHIPLAEIGRHRISAPVDEGSKLCFPVPFRYGIRCKALYICRRQSPGQWPRALFHTCAFPPSPNGYFVYSDSRPSFRQIEKWSFRFGSRGLPR